MILATVCLLASLSLIVCWQVSYRRELQRRRDLVGRVIDELLAGSEEDTTAED